MPSSAHSNVSAPTRLSRAGELEGRDRQRVDGRRAARVICVSGGDRVGPELDDPLVDAGGSSTTPSRVGRADLELVLAVLERPRRRCGDVQGTNGRVAGFEPPSSSAHSKVEPGWSARER